ncbi:hypothetical protein HN865_04240 [Candidatus Woesearchaeota archaeon]|jgi:hypothetical protein|nr:hypothetical protein [Candidatus Woesearchaeota archaeon]MBT6995340.1 hypothetical protein [Candidatus Woesearchaeota archaeon]MBT7238037.1 hypothetical protein [Candidatus Woesearchaeota archaeon]
MSLNDEIQEQYHKAIEQQDPDRVFEIFKETNLILPNENNIQYMIEIHEKYEPKGKKIDFLALYHDFIELSKN